jgi:hypothetical protein
MKASVVDRVAMTDSSHLLKNLPRITSFTLGHPLSPYCQRKISVTVGTDGGV